MRMRPWSGVSNPAISRSNVVLPQPDGPSSAKNPPRSIDNDTRSTAGAAPNRLLAWMMSRSAIDRAALGSAARLHAAPGAGAGALIGARCRQVDIQQPAHRFGRVDAGIVADLPLHQRRRR